MSSAAIHFYFDFISPYAWLGWQGLGEIAGRHGRDIEPNPILFAGLLDAHGQLGPAEIPAKRRYVFRDVWRKARRMGLSIEPPPAHPFNPLHALRAVAQLTGAQRRVAIDACFRAVWGGGGGVATPADVEQVLNAAGLDGPALIAGSRDPAIKARLRDNTDRAIAAGVFGVPSMIVDGELYWGTDSLVDVEAHLGGRSPGPPAAIERAWLDLPAAAVRPGSQRRKA